MWYFMLHSGVHATITGVLLAFAIPFGDGGEKSPSFILQHFLHKPVAFIVLPLFALANTCIAIGNDWLAGIGQTYSIGIIVGLVIGKPLGIWLFSYAAVAVWVCLQYRLIKMDQHLRGRNIRWNRLYYVNFYYAAGI